MGDEGKWNILIRLIKVKRRTRRWIRHGTQVTWTLKTAPRCECVSDLCAPCESLVTCPFCECVCVTLLLFPDDSHKYPTVGHSQCCGNQMNIFPPYFSLIFSLNILRLVYKMVSKVKDISFILLLCIKYWPITAALTQAHELTGNSKL